MIIKRWGRVAGIEESKSTGGKKKNERMACDFVYFSNVDTSAHSFFFVFFNWTYFSNDFLTGGKV